MPLVGDQDFGYRDVICHGADHAGLAALWQALTGGGLCHASSPINCKFFATFWIYGMDFAKYPDNIPARQKYLVH